MRLDDKNVIPIGFTGAQGVGKTAIANMLASSLTHVMEPISKSPSTWCDRVHIAISRIRTPYYLYVIVDDVDSVIALDTVASKGGVVFEIVRRGIVCASPLPRNYTTMVSNNTVLSSSVDLIKLTLQSWGLL